MQARTAHHNKLDIKQAAVALIALAAFVLYVREVATEYRAARAAAPGDHAALLEGIRYAPENAEYRFKLGESYLFSQDYLPAITHLQRSVGLNPNHAQAWLDLAHAYHFTGDSAKRQLALKRALEAAPNDQRVAWESANLQLATGDVNSALNGFKKIVQGFPDARLEAIRLCWRATHDSPRLVRELGINDPPAYRDLFAVLAEEPAAAKQVYGGFIATAGGLDPTALSHYLDIMQRKSGADVVEAWSQAESRYPELQKYREPGNALGNGSFENKIAFNAFDWQWKPTEGVDISTETADVKEGTQAVALHLDKPSAGSLGLTQVAFVRGEEFELRGYAKVEGPQGIQVKVFDKNGKELGSAELGAGSIWHEVSVRFRAGDSDRVKVDFVNAGSASLSHGAVKLDGFSLREVQR
jgi:tetratricopeptide (TPR) repeat protein